MSRPQKQCLFCDNPANSKEHFWPGWMHHLLPNLPEPRHSKLLREFHPSNGHYESGAKDRQGGMQTIKMRVVCTDCNNGWMNRLENQARPFLTALVTQTPIKLNMIDMTTVARWIAVKCIVSEHSVPDYDLTPREDRVRLREGMIPPYYRIYLANHNHAHGIGFMRHSLGLSLIGPPSTPPSWGTAKNIQTISFLLGRVLVHLNASRIENYSIEDRYIIPQIWNECRIWPFRRMAMTFPRRPLLDGNGIAVVAGALEAILNASDITWMEPAKPPRGRPVG